MGQAKQKREKIQAVIDAAKAWRDLQPDSGERLRNALAKYEEVTLSPDAPADSIGKFHCPYCDAEQPPYGWHFNIGDTGPFALQWITCFCGECKSALTVSVVQFMPKQELLDQLKKQFAGRLTV